MMNADGRVQTKLPTQWLGDTQPLQREFSNWQPWNTRRGLTDRWGYRMADYPGVYLLAHFDGAAPSGPADYESEAIVYVGMSRYLDRRLHQFDRTVHGARLHSGGARYRVKFGAGKLSRLHVSLLPVWFSEGRDQTMQPLSTFFAQWAESHVLCRLAAVRGPDRAQATLLNRY